MFERRAGSICLPDDAFDALSLGLVPLKTTAEQTADLLTPLIAPAERYETQVLLIEHGRKTCRAINPKCDECRLLRMCPTGDSKEQFLAQRSRRQRPASRRR